MTWCNFSTSLICILKVQTFKDTLLLHHSFPTQRWSSAFNLIIPCLFHRLVITLSQYTTLPSQTSLPNSLNNCILQSLSFHQLSCLFYQSTSHHTSFEPYVFPLFSKYLLQLILPMNGKLYGCDYRKSTICIFQLTYIYCVL